MPTTINAAHLRDRLFGQLSLPMQSWVMQQADQIVRSRRFGPWEEMRLKAAIQQKLQKSLQSWPPGGTHAEAASSILMFLVLTKAYDAWEQVQEKRQEWMTAFENFDQKVNQLFNLLATVLKTQSDATNITRNLI
jgi:hypothetical protein